MPLAPRIIKRRTARFLKNSSLRVWIIIGVLCLFSFVLIYRLFDLQIVKGEDYLDNFQLKIRKEVSIPSTRGNIYDRNGNLLAYNELAYSVTLKDTYEETNKNRRLNSTIIQVIDIITSNGDSLSMSFDIACENDGYSFTSTGTALNRFLADIYGHASVDDLSYEEKHKTAQQAVTDLAERYGIGSYTVDESTGAKTFDAGNGYTDDPAVLLQMVTIRYKLSLNSYQKYISTTIAENVSDRTVAEILESVDTLQGVNIEENTRRCYVDSKYFAQILGYTGKISTEELAERQLTDPDIDSNDTVGKSGIEKSMDSELQGRKGSETVYVDSLGKQLEVADIEEPIAGNDIYLTIDKDLQETAYDLLEKHLADILLAKLRNVKEYIRQDDDTSSDIILPIYDVYNAVFNNIISLSHLSSDDAGTNEKAVYSSFLDYRASVFDWLDDELGTVRTPYNALSREYQVYQSYMVQFLYTAGVLDTSKVDSSDRTYIAWTTDETISMAEFLEYCISAGWVDVDTLDLDTEYSESSEVMKGIIDYLKTELSEDTSFSKKLYKYMLQKDVISPKQTCFLLLEQNIVHLSAVEMAQFESDAETPYTFMQNRIANLELTPAQLSLDPYSGSMVITDPTSGDVLALVTYPSYDNNRMSNGVDAEYYESLRNDSSKPLINYATQQRTAPGSTFKMVTSTAGLCEGVITTGEMINCSGTFTKITPSPHCWVYPEGAHGNLTLSGAIRNSCNDYFYEVGYRLGCEEGRGYDSDSGVSVLQKYADLYGLTECSGIEIEEATPVLSTEDAVRSAIGQGNSGFTTAQLARYVTTVANSGTCYDLTLIDRIVDTATQLSTDNSAEIRNTISMPSENWDTIHQGMRMVVRDKAYFSDFKIAVAGKTGTAQENTSRPNHALFVCYAPFESPTIACATRIANGYSSDYAARLTRDVLSYYFGMQTKEELMNGEEQIEAVISGD